MSHALGCGSGAGNPPMESGARRSRCPGSDSFRLQKRESLLEERQPAIFAVQPPGDDSCYHVCCPQRRIRTCSRPDDSHLSGDLPRCTEVRQNRPIPCVLLPTGLEDDRPHLTGGQFRQQPKETAAPGALGTARGTVEGDGNQGKAIQGSHSVGNQRPAARTLRPPMNSRRLAVPQCIHQLPGLIKLLVGELLSPYLPEGFWQAGAPRETAVVAQCAQQAARTPPAPGTPLSCSSHLALSY